MNERIYSPEFGWLEVRKNDDPLLVPVPLPQTGEHPLADVLGWLSLDRATFEMKVEKLGLPPFEHERVDMQVLLAAVRHYSATHADDDSEEIS